MTRFCAAPHFSVKWVRKNVSAARPPPDAAGILIFRTLVRRLTFDEDSDDGAIALLFDLPNAPTLEGGTIR